MFSFATRIQNIQELANQNFDLCIIGGGITGAGVARDAASRGMKVALVEANDFASGTSSRSSKLIHGGIRYLENFEFGLVFEALTERSRLFRMAPHLVHPLRFVLPIYEDSRVGMFKMGLGMWLYDILSLFEMPELHEKLSSEETSERLPFLRTQDLKGSYAYSDAYTDDDRLVIETLRSAHAFGAKCANYVKACGANFTDGRVSAVTCKDQVTGKEFTINAKHFVSSVGPWTDEVANQMLGDWKDRLRPSKGVHLTFRRDRLPLKNAVVMGAQQRIVFGIPRHDMVIVGTTDTDYTGDPKDVCATREDVDYLLQVTNDYFPGAGIGEEDIVATYAGVRPLVDDGSSTEGKTSREHVIIDDDRGVIFVTGGKYTTYRHMAEETVATVLAHFPAEQRMGFGPSQTRDALNSLATINEMKRSSNKIESWALEFDVVLEDVAILVERHGSEAEKILKKYGSLVGTFAAGKNLKTRWLLEAHHAVDETMCIELLDFYLRRSPLFLAEKDHGLDMIEPLAKIFAQKLGWNDEERQKQIDAVRAHIAKELHWRVQPQAK